MLRYEVSTYLRISVPKAGPSTQQGGPDVHRHLVRLYHAHTGNLHDWEM